MFMNGGAELIFLWARARVCVCVGNGPYILLLCGFRLSVNLMHLNGKQMMTVNDFLQNPQSFLWVCYCIVVKFSNLFKMSIACFVFFTNHLDFRLLVL